MRQNVYVETNIDIVNMDYSKTIRIVHITQLYKLVSNRHCIHTISSSSTPLYLYQKPGSTTRHYIPNVPPGVYDTRVCDLRVKQVAACKKTLPIEYVYPMFVRICERVPVTQVNAQTLLCSKAA